MLNQLQTNWGIINLPNKKASVEAICINGADDRALLELFNKILHPVLTSSKEVLLYFKIEEFINGVEK